VTVQGTSDRRHGVRFDVLGAFWGTFDTGDPVRVHNLTHHGALIEAHQPLAVESVQPLCLTLNGEPTIADALVRHTRHAYVSEDHDRYLVGVEFLGASTAFLEAVDRLIAIGESPAQDA
jgi:hypothetical protein